MERGCTAFRATGVQCDLVILPLSTCGTTFYSSLYYILACYRDSSLLVTNSVPTMLCWESAYHWRVGVNVVSWNRCCSSGTSVERCVITLVSIYPSHKTTTHTIRTRPYTPQGRKHHDHKQATALQLSGKTTSSQLARAPSTMPVHSRSCRAFNYSSITIS